MIVVDASAVLAVLRDEPGADRVLDAVPDIVISAVNRSEVIAKLIDYGMEPQRAASRMARMRLDTHPFDIDSSDSAGKLRHSTARFGLSLGDRACLALAASLGCPAMTTDRAWAQLDIGVEIELIR